MEFVDEYTASIELSNACRQFYQTRVGIANCIKSKWEDGFCCDHCTIDNSYNKDRSTCHHVYGEAVPVKPIKNSVDIAMEKLRFEMTSLMEQDLSLMKQLLTLNEAVEDVKWQQRYYCHQQQACTSSNSSYVDENHCDSSASEDDVMSSFCPMISRLSCQSSQALTTSHSSDTLAISTINLTLLCSDTDTLSKQTSSMVESSSSKNDDLSEVEDSVKVYHREQNSFDSGIHETSSDDDVVISEST